MTVRSTARALSALAVFAVFAFPFGAAPSASAVTGHYLDGSIGAGLFVGINGMSVQSGSDLIAIDNGSQTARRFDLNGAPLGGFDPRAQLLDPQVAARVQSTGDVYIQGLDAMDSTLAIYRFSATGGSPLRVDISTANFNGFVGMAAAADGTLYVSDGGTNAIFVFNPDGTPAGRFGGTGPNAPVGTFLSVDGLGNLWAAQPDGSVIKFDAQGNPVSSINTASAGKVAADPSNNDVFVVDSPAGGVLGVTRYDQNGVKQQRFAENDAINFSALSVDGPTHTVFAANSAGPRVDVYREFVAPDVVTAAPPSDVTSTSADVTGTVNPNDQPDTSYYFEYGTDATYATGKTDPVNVATGSQPVAAPGTISGLKPNTQYHYRLVAANGKGPNAGEDQTFTTDAAPPAVSDETATAVTPTQARLNAQVNPNSNPTTAYFQYGKNMGYGTDTGIANLGSGSDPVPASKVISRLDPGTTYHYRVVAKNGVLPDTIGPDRTFVTPPTQPTTRAEDATGVTANSAQINGTIDTQGLTGTYSFRVTARNSAYTVTTETRTLGAYSGERAVSETLAGLPTGLTYDVRLTLTTSTGTVVSDPPSTFVTSVAAAPPPALAPAVPTDPFPYGCVTPRLTAPTRALTAGRSVTLGGTDLGVYGRVSFGRTAGAVRSWSATRIAVVVPPSAKGRVPISVTCGRTSNAVTGRVAPSNRFVVTKIGAAKNARATVSVRVPGKGSLSVTGTRVERTSAKASKAGTVRLGVALDKRGRAALRDARSGRLRTAVTIRYRPTGGTTGSTRRTLTFRR